MEPKAAVDPRSLLEHRDFVRAIVRRLLADEHAVEDVVQETCLRALERPPRHAGVKAWLARVARNLALTARRRERSRSRRERAGARPEAQPPAADAAASLERLRLVVEAVLALEEPFRSAILLRFYDDRKPGEIARELGVPVETVRSRLRRGLERMRARLDARHGGDRAAWSLALLLLLGAREAAAATATTKVLLAKGAIMSAKTKVAVAAALLVAAMATVTWQAASARSRAASPRARPRPVAGVEGVRGTGDGTGAGAPAEVVRAGEHLPDRGVGPPGAADTPGDADADEPKPYRIAEATGDAFGALRVIVTDDGRNGLPGAKVIVTDHRTARARMDHLVSGPDGRVEMRALEPGRRGVTAALGNRFRSASVEVAGGRFTEVTVAFDRGATLEGEVRHVERGPLPDMGVAIELAGREGFQEWCNTRTDGRGRYRMEGVPAGTHGILVWGGFLGHEQRPRASVTVTDPVHVTKDIVVGRVALRGTVTDADTLAPVAGARVSLHQPPRWNAVATTDERGAYEIADLAPGPHKVAVARDGYAMLHPPPLEILPDETCNADFALRSAATLVLEVLDADGRPVPGSHAVTAGVPGGPNLGFRIDADATGAGRYERILPGVYELLLAAPGYETAAQRVTVKPGENRVTFRLEPARAASRPSLQGTVRDSTTKEPLGAVRVRIIRPIEAETATGPDGVFRFRDLRPGRVAIVVSKDGHGVRYIEDVEVGGEEGVPGRLDLEIDPAATLHLHLTDRTGRPVVGRVYLGVNGRGEGRTEFGTSLDADAHGHAAYRQIVPGPYVLLVSQGGIGEASVETRILPGENVVRVRLE